MWIFLDVSCYVSTKFELFLLSGLFRKRFFHLCYPILLSNGTSPISEEVVLQRKGEGGKSNDSKKGGGALIFSHPSILRSYIVLPDVILNRTS